MKGICEKEEGKVGRISLKDKEKGVQEGERGMQRDHGRMMLKVCHRR